MIFIMILKKDMLGATVIEYLFLLSILSTAFFMIVFMMFFLGSPLIFLWAVYNGEHFISIIMILTMLIHLMVLVLFRGNYRILS